MPRRNYLASQIRMEKQTQTVVPQVYAAFALVLKENGNTDDEITELFAQTQEKWKYCIDNRIDMIALCEKQTGICLTGNRNKIH